MLLLVPEHSVLDGLDGHQVLRDLVAGQVHFAKGTSPEHPSNSIKLARALHHRPCLLQMCVYVLLQLLDICIVLLNLQLL